MCGYVQLVDPSGKAAQRHPSSSSTIGQRALSRMTTITAEVETCQLRSHRIRHKYFRPKRITLVAIEVKTKELKNAIPLHI